MYMSILLFPKKKFLCIYFKFFNIEWPAHDQPNQDGPLLNYTSQFTRFKDDRFDTNMLKGVK